MNIIYLSEINPFEWNGGGQTIERGIIEKGKELGHKIVNVTPDMDNRIGFKLIDEADFVICCDMDNRPTVKKWFDSALFEKIIAGNKYITMSMGYCDVCRQDYTPCNLTGKRHCSDCPKNDTLRVEFFKQAKLNVFLSILQAKASLEHLGIDKEPYICPPDLELDKFYNMGLDRSIYLLYAGVICEAKGYYQIIKYIEDNGLQDEKIVFAGDSLVGVPKYGEWVRKVDRDEMPKIYNRAKKFIQMSRWGEALGLTSVESVLCGCELIWNKKLGSMSNVDYDVKRLADKSNYQGNYKTLWNTIERL